MREADAFFAALTTSGTTLRGMAEAAQALLDALSAPTTPKEGAD